MRRFLPVLLLFITVLVPLRTVSAQVTITPDSSVTVTPTVSEEQKSSGNFIDIILGLFKKHHTGDIKQVMESSLPYMNFVLVQSDQKDEKDTAEVSSTDKAQTPGTEGTDEIDKVASYYTVANALGKPADPQKLVSNNIFDFFKSFFGTTIDKIIKGGNYESGELVARYFPAPIASTFQGETAENTDQVKTSGMNTDETKILGTQSDTRMGYALTTIQCSLLPAEIGKNLDCPVFTASALSGEENPWQEPVQEPIQQPPVGPGVVITASGLNYEIPFYKINSEYSKLIDDIYQDLWKKMDTVIVKAVKNRWPLSMIDKWQEIYQISYERNWNPALLIALWIEETGASDACDLLWERGVNGIHDIGAGSPVSYCLDSPEVRHNKLLSQLDAVLGMQQYWKLQTFEQFMCYFSPRGTYPCKFTETDLTTGWAGRLKDVYSCLLYPSSYNCPAGYFRFREDTQAENISLASDLVASIQKYCEYGGLKGAVRIENYTCLNEVVPPIPSRALSIMTTSATSQTFQALQCTAFVLAAKSITSGELLNNGGNAIDYATNIPDGYTFINKNANMSMHFGDLPVWSYDTYDTYSHKVIAVGHIAITVEVYDDNNRFKVAEANFDLHGGVRESVKTIDSPTLLGWLTRSL